MSNRPLAVCCPGEIPYTQALTWQKQRLEQGLRDPHFPDGLLLLSHPPVYTLGQGGDPRFLSFDPAQTGWEVHRVERGGEVTYHGPGQWVAYPILNLRRHQCDLHWYLRQLEAVVITVLMELDLPAERLPGLTGVWVEGYKVAAVGIKVTRWWTYHGLALNVCPDLTAFDQIVPCGITDRPVGSLTQFHPQVTMADIAPRLIDSFGQHFHLDPHQESLDHWLGGSG